MKNIIYAILLGLGLGGCIKNSSEGPAETHVTVLIDRSDSTMAELTLDDLRTFFEAERYFTSYHLRIRRLAESATDTVREAYLEGWSKLRRGMEVESSRKKERDKFLDEAEPLLAFPGTAHSTHSSIISPLVEELQALAKNEGARDMILVSDLAENSAKWSVYGRDGHALEPNLDVLSQELSEIYGIDGNYTGITLYILHRPQGFNQVQRFDRLVLLYRKLFEPLGLIVKPVANLH